MHAPVKAKYDAARPASTGDEPLTPAEQAVFELHALGLLVVELAQDQHQLGLLKRELRAAVAAVGHRGNVAPDANAPLEAR